MVHLYRYRVSPGLERAVSACARVLPSCPPSQAAALSHAAAAGVTASRAILKEAGRFPSKKRTAIIEDIKYEFHKNKVLTSKKEIKTLIGLAIESLEQLKSYNNLAGPDSEIYLKGPCQQG